MNDDVISRQAAIDVLKVGIDAIKLGEEILSHVLDDTGVVSNTLDKYEWGRELLKSAIIGIENLPSAQPEIIRCKDCKYCDRGIDEDGNPFLKCLGWVYGGTQEEDFCSHAERRTDD